MTLKIRINQNRKSVVMTRKITDLGPAHRRAYRRQYVAERTPPGGFSGVARMGTRSYEYLEKAGVVPREQNGGRRAKTSRKKPRPRLFAEREEALALTAKLLLTHVIRDAHPLPKRSISANRRRSATISRRRRRIRHIKAANSQTCRFFEEADRHVAAKWMPRETSHTQWSFAWQSLQRRSR